MVKNGITTNITVRHQYITGMSNYDKKSFEELRIEDYSRQGRASTTAEGIAGSFSLFKPVLEDSVIERKHKDTVNEQVHEDAVNKQEHEDGPTPQAEVKSSEEPSEYEKALEKRKKYVCVEHDEALKVYCHTDNCLICLVCQLYGKHAGHKCELVANMATTTREELFSETKKLDDHFELIRKSRRKLKDRKDSILQTQSYLQDRVAKHVALLTGCLTSGERALKSEIDVKTNEKIVPLDVQDRVMANVEEKCDLAYSLIEKCRKNDKTLVEEKPNISKLIEEVSSFIQKCELEPAETDNLSCYFEYDLFDKLKTQMGGVKVLKPGQKEGSVYDFNEQEMWEEGKTKDAEVQTDQASTELVHSEISPPGLDEAADIDVTAHVLENSPAPVDPNVDEKRDLDCNGNKNDNDDENKVELEKMVEVQTSYPVGPNLQISRDLQSSGEVVIGLQDQILEKVDRLAVADGDDDSDSAKEIESDD